jgi:hypothetical protein
MFTAGDIPWPGGKPRSYLAQRGEVLDHFERCLAALRERVTVMECYRYVYRDHEETTVNGAREVRITLDSCDASRPPLEIRTPRLIKAEGFRVPTNPPLALSSASIKSISVHGDELAGGTVAADSRPIYIIGGGKTAMDTAYNLITRFPGRAVHLVVGKGTLFLNRDRMFPSGPKRWFGGVTGLELALDVALMFDGDNEAEVLAHFRRRYSVNLDSRFTQYAFGLLSETENAVIRAGVGEVITDYLEDIEDRDGAALMRLRSGARRAIEAGSWIVNCTGYVMREQHPYEP